MYCNWTGMGRERGTHRLATSLTPTSLHKVSSGSSEERGRHKAPLPVSEIRGKVVQ
jgi:hypothetical protein